MDLGAWVTLANGNGVGLPGGPHASRRRAGESRGGEPSSRSTWADRSSRRAGREASTSDSPEILQVKKAMPFGAERARGQVLVSARAPTAEMLQEVAIAAVPVVQEQLGDLKLYRVPETTTVASRQSKQVRLLDRSAIPIETFTARSSRAPTRGSTARVAVVAHQEQRRKSSRCAATLRACGGIPAAARRAAAGARIRCARPRHRTRKWRSDGIVRPTFEVAATHDRCRTASRSPMRVRKPSTFELTLRFPTIECIVLKADRPVGTKNGRPIFRLVSPRIDRDPALPDRRERRRSFRAKPRKS